MIAKFLNIIPKLAGTSFVAPSAEIIGAVEIGKGAIVAAGTLVTKNFQEKPKLKIG